jgi:hypothetical protein
MARQLAVIFNRRLYGNPNQIPIDTSRISFLDCSIYDIFDPTSGRQFNVLVENMVDQTKWCKWNSNNGWRDNVQQKHIRLGRPSLELIYEADDEDLIDDDESNVGASSSIRSKPFTPSQVAQAFSHFTHWVTNGEYLVCDLQGIYNVERNTLQLSDPVIHSISYPTNPFWRTNRGNRGIDDFFMTHQCDEQEQLCQLVTGCEFQRTFA